MSEIVDRVAMALKAKAFAVVVQERASWQELARTAIEAMREPTQEMIDACDINIPTTGTITSVWADMIEEALK